MLVAMTIQPSILRTATAFVEVRASPPELALGSPFLISVDERGGSMSISVDMFAGVREWYEVNVALWEWILWGFQARGPTTILGV